MGVRAVDTAEWGHQGWKLEKAGMRGSWGREGPQTGKGRAAVSMGVRTEWLLTEGGGGLPRLRPTLHASAGHRVATLASCLRPCRGSFSRSLSSGPQAAGRVLVSLSPPAARQVQDEKAVGY